MTLARIAVAVSGGGRTLANLLSSGHLRDYQVAGVIASRSDCAGVAIAKQHGIGVYVATFAPDKNPTSPEAMYTWLNELGVELIALAGFIKRFPLDSGWPGKVINIHPSLLPEFGGHGMYGMKVHKAVIASSAPWSGATIHFVTDHYDEGAIIAQGIVSRRRDDTPEVLAERVFRAECRLYPRIITKLLNKELPLGLGCIERICYDDF